MGLSEALWVESGGARCVPGRVGKGDGLGTGVGVSHCGVVGGGDLGSDVLDWVLGDRG